MGHQIATADSRCQGLLHPSCNRCSLSNLCLPLAVSHSEIDQLESVVERGKTVNRGDHIFQQSDEFTSFFALRSGAIKTYIVSESGEEQITGFYLPGEIIGLDSMNTPRYSCSAKALDRTSVCEIPIEKLEHLASRIPSLQHHFFQLMSKEIQESHQLNMLLSKNTAEERISTLLLSLASRFERRKLSATHFRLPMARNDMANYLGLAVETVSRVLTRFQKQDLVALEGREVFLKDPEGLRKVARAPLCN